MPFYVRFSVQWFLIVSFTGYRRFWFLTGQTSAKHDNWPQGDIQTLVWMSWSNLSLGKHARKYRKCVFYFHCSFIFLLMVVRDALKWTSLCELFSHFSSLCTFMKRRIKIHHCNRGLIITSTAENREHIISLNEQFYLTKKRKRHSNT